MSVSPDRGKPAVSGAERVTTGNPRRCTTHRPLAPPPHRHPKPRSPSIARHGDRRIRNRVVEEHRWLAVVIARSYQHRQRAARRPRPGRVRRPREGRRAVRSAVRRRVQDVCGGHGARRAAAATSGTRRGPSGSHAACRSCATRSAPRPRCCASVSAARPTRAELADYLHVEPDEIIDCLCADSNFRSLSIDHVEGGEHLLGDDDRANAVGYATVESHDAFAELAGLLPERLRRIVEMRFVDEMKQSDIAAEIGVSQVQISRLLRQATDRLRPLVEHRHRVAEASA